MKKRNEQKIKRKAKKYEDEKILFVFFSIENKNKWLNIYKQCTHSRSN